MGLQSTQIRHLLTVKNVWLSVIGIIIGTPLGNISLNAMMNSNGENFDMGDMTFEEFVEKYNGKKSFADNFLRSFVLCSGMQEQKLKIFSNCSVGLRTCCADRNKT